ncbi:hypothetical protein [Tenacibaculum sp. 190524A02b]
MKNSLFTLFFFVFSLTLQSQSTEIVMTNGTQQNLLNIINNNFPNSQGTISIKGIININSNITVPDRILLNFYNGGKFLVSNTASLQIRGSINASKNQIFQVGTTNHRIKIYNQSVYPEWFGDCHYQNATIINDSPTIQKAINSLDIGGEILFKGNKYLVGTEIAISIPSISLKGKRNYFSGPDKTCNLIANNTNVSSIFNVKIYGVRFNGLNLEGYINDSVDNHLKGENTINKAISFIRSDNTKDLDGEVKNCMFKHFENCIYGRGTNLNIMDNTFVASNNGITINEALHSNVDKHGARTRGHRIVRNRFHSLGSTRKHATLTNSTCIKIEAAPHTPSTLPEESYTIRGFYNEITDNYADDCKTFFEGIIDRSKIDGNLILYSGGTAIKAFGGLYGTITNNIIDGSHTYNAHKLYSLIDCNDTDNSECDSKNYPSGHGIHIRYAHNTTVHNNQILNKRFHGIYIERSKNSSIQFNTIRNFNRHRYSKISGINIPKINDERNYDGIHVKKIQNNGVGKYNIQNIIANNTISITHTKVEGRYGIYLGDGDDWNFVKNNFILGTRLQQTLKKE